MQRKYLYISISLHIVIFLLCAIDISFFPKKREFNEQPPIIVNLDDIKISDMTNLPEKAIFGEEKKLATRKDDPTKENSSAKKIESKKTEEINKPEPEKIEEIKSPSLIEDAPKLEESKETPKKESPKPIKEKKKPAPIPQRKPQIKQPKKVEPKKKPEIKSTGKQSASASKKKVAVKNANPLESLMNSVDDLQKQIGEENAPAQIPHEEPVNNMGVEGGNSRGSYFSELSISGKDFVESKIQESWNTTTGGKDDRNIEVVINVFLTKDGVIQSIEIEDMGRYRSDPYFQALADSAERAIKIAQDTYKVFVVFASQNGSSYSDWKTSRFTFTPLGLAK